jgi:predicted Zn-dependent peptidase
MIKTGRLPCGVRTVYEKIEEAQSACIGIWVGAGSYCEGEDVKGISHYIEHMFFKGTEKRTAMQIAQDTDKIGAHINAFTSKEATCYHIKALTDQFPAAVDILLDMLCNSLFDPKEMKKERGVILEEMSMIEDTPDDYILDLLTAKVLAKTDIESSIIGTRKSLKSINRDKILNYIKTNYTKDNIVVAVVGNFDEEALSARLDAALSDFEEKKPPRPENNAITGIRFQDKSKDVGQTHIAIGIPSIPLGSDQYYAQAVVNEVLGGSMSSRLFQNIREQKGLAYTVYSAAACYAQVGMFYIYAGVTMGKAKEALSAIAFELEKLGREAIGKEDIDVVKQRLKSGYIFSLESMNSRMYRLGKNSLILGRHYTPEETLAEIDSVTQEEVETACSMLGKFDSYSGVSISKDKLNMKALMEI